MTTTGKHERKVAVMTTVAATMFSTVIALAYFVTCLATMLSATVDWSLGTIAAMLLCAAGPTFWLAYRLHRDIRRHQKSKAPSSLFVRQLATFAKSLRVPALLLAAEAR